MTDLIADALLLFGCLGATFYCLVLSRRISHLNQFEGGLGGAIAVLSAQVDDMQKALAKTEETATAKTTELSGLLNDTNEAAARLEMLLAGMDDLAQTPAGSTAPRGDTGPETPPEKADITGETSPDSADDAEVLFVHRPRKAHPTGA